MAIGGKVLKIDIIVDESGQARRTLSETERGVKQLDYHAQMVAPSIARLDKSFADMDKSLTATEQSIKDIGQGVALTTGQFFLMSASIGAVVTVAGAAGAAIYGLATHVKDSSALYIEQSGVLEINAAAIDRVTEAWERAQYVLGEVVIGGQGDFTAWESVATTAIAVVTLKLTVMIEEARMAGRALRDAFSGPFSGIDTDPSDIDSTMRNPDGSLTPAGILAKQKKAAADPWRGGNDPLGLKVPIMDPGLAESITMKQITEEKRAQLELEREQKREAQERFRQLQEQVRLEQDATNAILRSKEAIENEIEAARRLNETRIQGLDISLRDSFLKSTMSGEDFDTYSADAATQRKIAAIDPRAANAEQLRRRYEAENAFGKIQKRQGQEGFTTAIADELHAFRIQYQDIIGELPQQFQQILPSIATASGQMREALTSDLQAVQQAQQITIAGYDALAQRAASPADRESALTAADDAYRKAGFFVQQSADISRLRSSGGSMAGAIPSRGGSSVVIEKGAIDARGAQFTNDASMEALAARIAQKLGSDASRFG